MIVHPNFDPVAISLGPIEIHWYGLMYLLGFVCAILLGQYRANKRKDWQKDEVSDMVFYLALGVILGGRLGSVIFYNLPYYLQNPFEVFAIWDGGMSFHGGLLGVVVAMYVYARKTQKSFLNVADFVAPLVPPGLFFGRIGNFINQELWGKITDVPWAVLFHTKPDAPRHPSQLYEAALEGLLLFIILWLYSAKPRVAGSVAGLFVLGYGVFRFMVEFVREPDAHLGSVFLGLSMGQILCLPMIVFGLYFLLRKNKAKQS